MNSLDAWISSADNALRTLSGAVHASRPAPTAVTTCFAPPVDAAASSASASGETLTADERRMSGALMRVNHVGEVCAQALYQAQALTARTPQLRAQMHHAAREETDHLAWTQQRLDELGARASLLNPLWYAGAFGIGLLAGRLGDRVSLGFVVETERQVEAHLASHLQRLPDADARSRAIVQTMHDDERRHADQATAAGGVRLPLPVRWLMRAASRVMTGTAYRV